MLRVADFDPYDKNAVVNQDYLSHLFNMLVEELHSCLLSLVKSFVLPPIQPIRKLSPASLNPTSLLLNKPAKVPQSHSSHEPGVRLVEIKYPKHMVDELCTLVPSPRVPYSQNHLGIWVQLQQLFVPEQQ